MKTILKLICFSIIIIVITYANIVIAVNETLGQENTTDDTEISTDQLNSNELINTSTTQDETQAIATVAETTSNTGYPITDFETNWKNLTDEEANECIKQIEATDLKTFLNGLSEEDLQLLLQKDTMLNNTTKIGQTIYNGASYTTKKYYEYLMSDCPGTNYSGHFYIQFKIDENKSTTYKIDLATYGSGYGTVTYVQPIATTPITTDEYNLRAYWVSQKTQPDSVNSTAYYIYSLGLKYTKPEHCTFTDGGYINVADGYRFSFSSYTTSGGGASTITAANGNTRA